MPITPECVKLTLHIPTKFENKGHKLRSSFGVVLPKSLPVVELFSDTAVQLLHIHLEKEIKQELSRAVTTRLPEGSFISHQG